MKKLILILLFSIFSVQASNPPEEFCTATVFENTTIQAQTGGLYKPSSNGQNEYMKVLVVFVQFQDDDRPDQTWPINQLPTWADDLIDSTPSTNYRELTISEYWQDMSMNNFDFIGDVYPNLVIINSEQYYDNNNYDFGECNKDALIQVDQNPNFDFSDYDNWGYNSSTQSFEFVPDGNVDMILMIYRDPIRQPVAQDEWFGGGFGVFHAIALLSDSDFTLNFDGVNVVFDDWISSSSSGLTVRSGKMNYHELLHVLAHEYGHFLFGAGHSNTAGVMSQGPHSSFSFNAVERERLGYIAYTNCTQDNFTITLEDFITHGDILRIPIPITDQNSSTFFLVENHQRLSNHDQIIRGGPLNGQYNFTTDIGSGIYIWLVENGDSPIRQVQYEAVTADGRWDWLYDGDYYVGPGWYVDKPYEGYIPQTKRNAVNRHNGKSEKLPNHIWWNSHYAHKWVDINPETEEYELTRDIMGDEYDAYNFGYNELFTPWSNPSSYVNGDTDISLQLYNENGDNITVKVFTTSSSSEALPPSRPEFFQLTTVGSTGPNPALTWENNIEPDLSYYEIWKKMGHLKTGFYIQQHQITFSMIPGMNMKMYITKSELLITQIKSLFLHQNIT
jgi:M6 family metalloprotease-like protein